MTTTIEAIYEAGILRPLQKLSLPDQAHVWLRVQEVSEDTERAEWLAQGERGLMQVWNNDSDEVYNDLLTP